MELNKTTRLDVKDRLALITRRLSFIADEIGKLEDEKLLLTSEKELLEKLSNVYASHKNDPIDDGRSEFLKEDAPKPNSKRMPPDRTGTGGVRQAVLDLLESGPASITELADASGFETRSITNTLCLAKKAGQVVNIGRGVYQRGGTHAGFSG